MLLALLALACMVDPDRRATPGSPAAEEVEAVRDIAERAREIERLAAELTAQVDESRRGVLEGRADREAEIARMREMMRRLEELDVELQERVRALDARLHERAGDPAWPPEPLDRRRR